MIIANFREYLEYIRNMFVPENTSSIDAYVVDMRKSGQKQKETREKLKKEIAIITAKINFLREQLKAENNKQKISQQIKLLKTNKVELLKKLKQQSQVTRFAMLSDETKTVLCTLKVLRKYLTKELMENEFSGMKKDESGNLIFDSQVFENSFLYQDTRHVFDYISAYIVQNPGKVLSESYFNKFFDKESGWRGIVNHADKFFDAQNKRKKTRAEIIAESKSDIEIVREYTESKVILVRLKTPEALDYEGTAAHNCVGGGSYDKLLNKKQSGIYSLRRLTKDGELKPVVTIEYNDGIVKQIHGPCNGIVGFDYTMVARDAVLRLMNLDSIQDLVADKRFTDNILGCLGLYRDGKGSYFDIMTISEDVDFEIPKLIVEASSIKDYDFEKLKIKDVVIEGELTSADVKYISKFKHANKINIKALGGDCYIDLQGFDELEKLEIDAKEYACTIANCGENIEKIKYSGDKLPVIIGSKEIPNLELYIRTPQTFSLNDIPSAKKISIFARPDTFMNVEDCKSTAESVHFEEVALGKITTNEFPNLQHLEVSGCSCNEVGYFPKLKTLKCNFFANEDKEFDLSLFPKIEKIRIVANNDYEINIPEHQEIKELNLLDAKHSHTCTLKGKGGKIQNLDVGSGIKVRSEFEGPTKVQRVSFHDTTVDGSFLHNLRAEDVSFDRCTINTDVAKKYITGSVLRKASIYDNKIEDEIADFSDCEVINMDGLLELKAKKIILPEKLDYLSLPYSIDPGIEVVGRCCPKTLKIHSYDEFLNHIDVSGVENFSCYEDVAKDFLPLMRNLKHLQSYYLPLELISQSVEIWDVYDNNRMSFSYGGDSVSLLTGKLYDERIDLWNAENIKKLSVSSLCSGVKEVILPQNVEECKIQGQCKSKEMDFSKYKKLRKLELNILDENIEKVKLPANIEELKADKSDIGIGIVYYGDCTPVSIEWEIPETANPEVIKYLQNQYGNDNVRLLKEQKTQNLLPMVIWQQKGLGGSFKS